ncbi:3D domain-containing protein [Tepidimicrobium xylanilyticum]
MANFTVTKSNKFKMLTVLAITASLSLGVYMHTAKDITISIDGEEKNIITYKDTVEDLLKQENISLTEGVYINVPLDAKLENNMNIIIKTPKTYILAFGDKKVEVNSVENKVQDILKDLNVDLGEKDYTYPGLDDIIAPGSEIMVTKVTEVIEEHEEVIAHEKIVRKNNRLDIGNENTIQEGKDGLKKVKVKKTFENGQLVSEDILEEEIIEEAIPHIVERGTKNILISSRGNIRYIKAITMIATAYDLSYESTGKRPGDKYYGITASGTKARPGVVAVDPRVIPLGTKLYVQSLDGTEDYGFCVAEDTGGAIKGNKIDLFFNTAKEVKQFGRRKVKVYILDNR